MHDENCPLCKDPLRGMSWTRLILNHHRTAMDCAKDFGIEPEAVNNHIFNHLEQSAFQDPNSPDYIRNKMLKFANILELWFDDMVVDRKIDRATMELALKLVKEIRESAKVIAEIDGQINKSDPKVQIINITNDFKKLTNVIMMDCCDNCRPKMISAVENMQITIPGLTGGKQ